MHKSRFNANACFDKFSFFKIIDAREKFNYATRQFYWEEYVISCNQDLELFYKALDPSNPSTPYIQGCINRKLGLNTEKFPSVKVL